ncbi:hypothetical protein C8R47DRAFT_1072117 [Mycena vitilis]|nr:hypothetical protein C8R47DRAFT_1072117 [Mycena vitilis]
MPSPHQSVFGATTRRSSLQKPSECIIVNVSGSASASVPYRIAAHGGSLLGLWEDLAFAVHVRGTVHSPRLPLIPHRHPSPLPLPHLLRAFCHCARRERCLRDLCADVAFAMHVSTSLLRRAAGGGRLALPLASCACSAAGTDGARMRSEGETLSTHPPFGSTSPTPPRLDPRTPIVTALSQVPSPVPFSAVGIVSSLVYLSLALMPCSADALARSWLRRADGIPLCPQFAYRPPSPAAPDFGLGSSPARRRLRTLALDLPPQASTHPHRSTSASMPPFWTGSSRPSRLRPRAAYRHAEYRNTVYSSPSNASALMSSARRSASGWRGCRVWARGGVSSGCKVQDTRRIEAGTRLRPGPGSSVCRADGSCKALRGACGEEGKKDGCREGGGKAERGNRIRILHLVPRPRMRSCAPTLFPRHDQFVARFERGGGEGRVRGRTRVRRPGQGGVCGLLSLRHAALRSTRVDARLAPRVLWAGRKGKAIRDGCGKGTQVKSKILGWAPTSLLQLTKTSSGAMDTQSESTRDATSASFDLQRFELWYSRELDMLCSSIYDTNGVPESVLGATNAISRFEKRRQAAADASQPGLARLSCVYGPRVATRGPSGFVPTGRKLRLTAALMRPLRVRAQSCQARDVAGLQLNSISCIANVHADAQSAPHLRAQISVRRESPSTADLRNTQICFFGPTQIQRNFPIGFPPLKWLGYASSPCIALQGSPWPVSHTVYRTNLRHRWIQAGRRKAFGSLQARAGHLGSINLLILGAYNPQLDCPERPKTIVLHRFRNPPTLSKPLLLST